MWLLWLLLLLLELLLELRRDGRHGGRACLEALLRLGLAREARELLLERRLRLAGWLTLHRETSILLLQWLLSKAGRLRCERTGLLLAWPHVAEAAAILLLLLLTSWPLTIRAQKGVRVGIHDVTRGRRFEDKKSWARSKERGSSAVELRGVG